MSHWSKYGTRDGGDEDQDPLLTSSSHQPVRSSITEPTQRFHPYSVVGMASAVIVGVILIVSITAPGSSSSSSEANVISTPVVVADKSTSYHKGTKRTNFGSSTISQQRELFEDFKKKFNRVYNSQDEEESRFKNFQEFLSNIDERNAKEADNNGKAVHGITQFADLSQEEFVKGYLKFHRSSDNSEARKQLKLSPFNGKKLNAKKNASSDTKTVEATLTSVDWTGIYTTAVKDQGYCGSCWAFSAAQQIESDGIRHGYLTTTDALSTQQIVSCDPYDLGCGGGDTVTAYAYAYLAGGVTTETQYPYVSYWGTTYSCNLNDDTKLVKPISYYLLKSEDAMEEYVLSTGPVSVCVDATEWATYASGIVSSCGMSVNHCVQVVGVNTEARFWKVRNSWGTSWGDRGFIYLETEKNICNIASEATYVDLVKV